MSPHAASEPRIYTIKLRDSEINVVAMSLEDALKAWRRECESSESIDLEEGDEPDSVVTDELGGWVAISEAASKAYREDLAERERDLAADGASS